VLPNSSSISYRARVGRMRLLHDEPSPRQKSRLVRDFRKLYAISGDPTVPLFRTRSLPVVDPAKARSHLAGI